MTDKMVRFMLLGSLLAVVAAPGWAVEQIDAGTADKATLEKVHPNKPDYSPYAGRNFPTRPLFGDTHLHTAFSMDAGAFGARLGPREAYRFAHGEEIMSIRSAGETLAAAGFSGRRRSLGRYGLLPDLLGGDPEIWPTRTGTQMARDDPCRSRAQRRAWTSS